MEQIKVFISWSGDRSRAMGEALRKWLPHMNQLIRPWMSAQDIGAGSLWFQETSKELSESQFGIICLTSDNLKEPWLYFEAGALFDILEKQRHRICPYLFDLDPSEVKGPLSHFQAKQATKESTFEILNEINKLCDDSDRKIIDESFDRFWPDLENDLNSISNLASNEIVQKREPTDMLQELLDLVREQSQVVLENRSAPGQKERAEIIIKILKEGIYGSLGDIQGLCDVSFFGNHKKEIREKLENELLDMALTKR
jgi:hypothetical protein